jgi:hypothetical protein
MGTKESRHSRVAARQVAGHLSGVPTEVRAQSKRASSASMALLPTNGFEAVRRGLICGPLPSLGGGPRLSARDRFRRQLHRTETGTCAASSPPGYGYRAGGTR